MMNDYDYDDDNYGASKSSNINGSSRSNGSFHKGNDDDDGEDVIGKLDPPPQEEEHQQQQDDRNHKSSGKRPLIRGKRGKYKKRQRPSVPNSDTDAPSSAPGGSAGVVLRLPPPPIHLSIHDRVQRPTPPLDFDGPRMFRGHTGVSRNTHKKDAYGRKRPLYKTLNDDDDNNDNDELSSLIGLATTLQSTTTTASSSSSSSSNSNNNNPLLQASFSNPPPPSVLKYVKGRASSVAAAVGLSPQLQNSNNNNNNKTTLTTAIPDMDVSGTVAASMVLEEAVTASLLPLAGLHVLRCRALEQIQAGQQEEKENDEDGGDEQNVDGHGVGNGQINGAAATAGLATSDQQQQHQQQQLSQERSMRHPITGEMVRIDLTNLKWKDETSWEEWTLPPEEAIMKLLEQGMISTTGWHYGGSEVTRQLMPCPPRPPSNVTAANAAAAAAVEGTNRSNSKRSMAKVLGVKAAVAAANQELFGIFAPPKK